MTLSRSVDLPDPETPLRQTNRRSGIRTSIAWMLCFEAPMNSRAGCPLLTERRPFAIWQNQGKYVLIDREGHLVTDEEVAKFRDLPLIVGPGAPEAAQVLLDALTDRPALQTRVVAAMRISERRWNLRMKNGTDILLPEGHEVAALDRLLVLQQETALLDRPMQWIDMRLGDRLVLRPLAVTSDKPEPAPPAPKKPI